MGIRLPMGKGQKKRVRSFFRMVFAGLIGMQTISKTLATGRRLKVIAGEGRGTVSNAEIEGDVSARKRNITSH